MFKRSLGAEGHGPHAARPRRPARPRRRPACSCCPRRTTSSSPTTWADGGREASDRGPLARDPRRDRVDRHPGARRPRRAPRRLRARLPEREAQPRRALRARRGRTTRARVVVPDATARRDDRDCAAARHRASSWATRGSRRPRRSADVVLNAVVGFAGVPATLAALARGPPPRAREQGVAHRRGPARRAGPRDRRAPRSCPSTRSTARSTSASRGSRGPDPMRSVRRLVLTASGGPFRGRGADELAAVSVDDALDHPTWRMGAKVTIDSSTLMNKGLEVLEAAALFGVDADRVDVVVHPQSIVHSMVELVDGSTIAQLSLPDMRLPIAYALGYPDALRRRLRAPRLRRAARAHLRAAGHRRVPVPRARLRGGPARAAPRRRG